MKKFKRIDTLLKDVYLIETHVFEDSRGYFMETFHQEHLKEMGIDVDFVQDNESKSSRGVLRGLHFQSQHPQGKLVRVVQGEIFDVAVDLRIGSPTYGKSQGFMLSENNHMQLYIPEGFAHGFLVRSEKAIFQYKCTDFYNPMYEGGIAWDDPALAIQWPLVQDMVVSLSEKDKQLKTLKDIKSPFKYEKSIKKEDIELRPINRADIEQIRLWRNEESVYKNFVHTQLISEAEQMKWYEKYQINTSDRMMMIMLNGKSIGTIALYAINESTKEAEFGRLLIGEYSARGKGIGLRATRMSCEYGFKELGLERIKLEVFKDNLHAIKVYEEVGFKAYAEKLEADRYLVQMELRGERWEI